MRKTPLEKLFEQARGHQPLGDPGSFGFETRLRAALGDAGSSEIELLARLSWRFTLAALPVVLVAALFVGFQHAEFLPEGLGGVISQWSLLFPGDLF